MTPDGATHTPNPADITARPIVSSEGDYSVSRSHQAAGRYAACHVARTLLEEDGKTIRYEHAGRSWSGTVGIPSATISGDDGEVCFAGLAEMRAARDALTLACSMAEVAS